MEPGDPLLCTAVEPTSLAAFVAELEADGFRRVDERVWQGPTRHTLTDGGHSTAGEMTVIFRLPWPYLPPLLHVPGISAWHADQELLCIWEADDNTQRWTTLQGLYDRIDEWVARAEDGFLGVETARNPEIYWHERPGWAGLVDLDGLVGNDGVDGQHGEFHFTHDVVGEVASIVEVFDIFPGPFTHTGPRPSWVRDTRTVRGRWFYREGVNSPPRDLGEFQALLTDNQRGRLEKDFKQKPILLFGLIWANSEGLVCSMLRALRDEDGRRNIDVGALRPKGTPALLLRSGRDATTLQRMKVAIVGAGAIGSHLAELLARSGVSELRLFDPDRLWPANLIRHAAPPDTAPGIPKAMALKDHLGHYPWVQVDAPAEGSGGYVWGQAAIREIVEQADLTVDATGHAGFAELAARVALDCSSPYVTVALFRGGSVARVRRQAMATDTPILHRSRLGGYLAIPPLADELEYAGTEVGCLARVHNAPPVAVVRAAALASEVVIDHLCGRNEEPEETVEVLRIGDEPFHRLGRMRPEDVPITVDLSENARWVAIEAADAARPVETGGILVGTEIDRRITVSAVVEVSDPDARQNRYQIGEGAVAEALARVKEADPRVGYLGEWHSHPDGSGPSTLDVATMLSIAADSDCANPVLLLVLPADHEPRLAAFVTTAAGLKPAAVEPCGDLPEMEAAAA